MLKIAEILQQKGQTIRLFLFLVPYISFLFASLKRIRQFSSIFNQISECSKLLKYFKKRDRSKDVSYCFVFHLFVSYLSLSNYSDSFLEDSTRYLDVQNCWNILTFFKNFYSAQNFSCSTPMFFSFLPCTERVFLLEQNQFLQLLQLVEILHQNFKFDFLCSIIVPQWRRKKLLFI